MQVGPASASQGSDRSVSGGGCSVAELSDFEHERLLRLWLVAVTDRAEDDDAVWSARELLACNQHGHWSGNHLPPTEGRANLAPSWRGVTVRSRISIFAVFYTRSQTLARHQINFRPLRVKRSGIRYGSDLRQ